MKSVSVVVPVYNEEGNVESFIEKLRKYVKLIIINMRLSSSMMVHQTEQKKSAEHCDH